MGLFYHPPQPPTASNAGTPPEPHVPIGNQGNQPPRRTIAVLMLAVLASWPADLEPRLQKPNERQQNIAPLTLPYGQQPPRIGTALATFYQTVVGNWPLDLEPRLALPNNLRQTIAPLTLRYGDAPPVVGGSAITEALIVSQWPLDLEPRLGPPNQQQQHIAPLTLVYGDQPPRVGTSGSTRAQIVVGAWPPDLEPRLGVPNNLRVVVAPLTLVYGSQPTPTPPLNLAEWTAITAPLSDWAAQGPPRSLAWLVPPVVSAYQAAPPFPYALVLASWPADLEPRLTRPNDQRQKMAPLTLPYGQPPPIVGTSAINAALVLAQWVPLWVGPPRPPSVVAALYVPPTPSTRGPAIIMVDGRLAIRLDDFNYAWIA